ncbi:MAG: sugar nucleotide-binding protein [Verrucomicrobia bacterium]|nr:sugar nucleotide-binding protein [Verrucomicrobiota bacterium]
MLILLGASGYIGQAFARELLARGTPFLAVSRKERDYTRFEPLLDLLREVKPQFLINAAGYTGKPNVDACETARAETLAGNTLLPQTIAHACAVTGTPWGHVSSGCIYDGAKVVQDSQARVEKDLTRPEVRTLAKSNPNAILGFTENDEPNFSFRRPPCSFYSGTKALAEEAIARLGENYIWRLRIPFDEFDNSRNYLTKVQRYAKVYENMNSISHRGDFVRACLELWERRAPCGVYNVTNPGWVTTRQVVEKIQSILKPNRSFEFWASDEEFYRAAAKTPRSNCVMDVRKLLSAGIKMRSVEEALEHALRNWRSESEK